MVDAYGKVDRGLVVHIYRERIARMDGVENRSDRMNA